MWFTSGGAQSLNLGRLQSPMGSRRQIAQRQGTDADALQAEHRMPDGLAHAADLSLSPLMDRDLQQIRRQAPDPSRCREPVLQHDALAKRPERSLPHRS